MQPTQNRRSLVTSKSKGDVGKFPMELPKSPSAPRSYLPTHDPIEFPPLKEILQGRDDIVSHAGMGLPPSEPAYHPYGLKSSAASTQEINRSKTLTDLAKDLHSLLRIGKQNATNTWKAQMSIQTDPDKGYGVQLPHHSTLIIKSTLEGRTVHWSNPHEHTSPKQSSQEPAELPYQEGPPLPPPRAEEDPEDSS